MEENEQMQPEIDNNPINKKFFINFGILLLLILVGVAGYLLYIKKQPPATTLEQIDTNKEFFNEELLTKLGHPEKYVYAYGVVKEINAPEKTILIESGSSGSFMGTEPRPENVQAIHVVVKDSTELFKILIFNQLVSQDNAVPKAQVSKIKFQDIKQGDTVSIAILPEQADRLDYFEAEKFQVQQSAGQ